MYLQQKEVFGPLIWKIIHKLSLNFQYKYSIEFQRYIMYICKFLPCDDCKKHFYELLQKYPINKYMLDDKYFSGNSIFLWSYFIHDNVNKRLNKKSPSISSLKKYYKNLEISKKQLWNMIHLFSLSVNQYNYNEFVDFVYLTSILFPFFYGEQLLKTIKQYPITDFIYSYSNNSTEDKDSGLIWTLVIKDELDTSQPLSDLKENFSSCHSCNISNNIRN